MTKVNHKTMIEIISFLVTMLFVYAATAKLLDEAAFRQQLALWPLVAGFAGLIAIVLPVVELGIAAMLTVKNTRFYGLLLSLLLLVVFTGYIGGMLLSGKPLPCSCGGLISELSWKEHLLFNLFFIALSVTALVLEKKKGYQNSYRQANH